MRLGRGLRESRVGLRRLGEEGKGRAERCSNEERIEGRGGVEKRTREKGGRRRGGEGRRQEEGERGRG